MRSYLDHAAGSPLRPEARAAVLGALEEGAGNPSSLHREGRRARALVEAARRNVASLAGAKPREVVFTSGASEAISAAVRGVCDRARSPRRIVVSSIEHSAVLEAARARRAEGFEVVEVAPTSDGRIPHEAFVDALAPGACLAALQAANNETGVVQPVEEIAATCRERGIPLLCDAVQAVGKLPAETWGQAPLVAISSHKIGGPQGAGALVVRDGLLLSPLVAGGAQERRRRGGTESVAAIAGFGAAAALREGTGRIRALREALEAGLRVAFPGARVHGDGASRLPGITNVAIPGIDGELLVIALDLEGLAVATGSACASGAVEPSHVLLAMGLPEDDARRAVRVSLGWSTTEGDVARLLDVLPRVVGRMRGARAALS